MVELADLLFYLVAVITISSGAYAVFTRNIVRAVFSLLGTFLGIAALYGFLSADFIAVIQILVYVGGILVLMLFAVMLTGNIESASRSSRSGGWFFGLIAGGSLLIMLITLALRTPWKQIDPDGYSPTTSKLGHALLNDGLLPFELLSIVLLGVVIGAVVVARFGRKEIDA